MKAILVVVSVLAVACGAAGEESSPKNNEKREIKEYPPQHPAYHYRGLQHHHQQYQQHQQHHEGQNAPQNHYVYYQRSAAHSGSHQHFEEPHHQHQHEWEVQKARAHQEYHSHAHSAQNLHHCHSEFAPHLRHEYIQHNHINNGQHSFEHLPQPQKLQQHFWNQQNPTLVKHVVAHKVVYPNEAVQRYIPVAMSVPQVRVEKKVQPETVVVQKSIPIYMEKQVLYPVQQSAVHEPIQKEVSVIRVPHPMAVHVDKPYPVYVPHHVYMEKPVPVQVIIRDAGHHQH